MLKRESSQHVKNLLGMFAVPFVMAFVTDFVISDTILKEVVRFDDPNRSPDEWRARFELLAYAVLGITFITCLVWYGFGEFLFETINWRRRGRRTYWYLFFIPPLLTVIVVSIVTKAPLAPGILYIFLIYLCLAIICYYLSTAFFSASAFKYLPPGSQSLRRARTANK
jgi:hypothetical protein